MNFIIRKFANNVSQTLLAKTCNIINQYGRKPLKGEFCLRAVFELSLLQGNLLNKLGIIQVNN